MMGDRLQNPHAEAQRRGGLTVLHFLVTLVFFVVALGIGSFWGMKRGAFQSALEENKLAAKMLNEGGISENPAFEDYLKGRIYYNIASKFPNDQGYLSQNEWDFGKVEFSYVIPQPFAKDPTCKCDSFQAATQNLSSARNLNSDY